MDLCQMDGKMEGRRILNQMDRETEAVAANMRATGLDLIDSSMMIV